MTYLQHNTDKSNMLLERLPFNRSSNITTTFISAMTTHIQYRII